MSDMQRDVHALLDELVGSGAERGVQAAVYRHGEQLVDAVAGTADPATGRPMTSDTPVFVTSTGKGVAATVVHVLAERGAIAHDTPIAALWPEFAAPRQAGRHGDARPDPRRRRAGPARPAAGRRVPRSGRIPAGATSTARALTRMYAALLADVDGVRLISAERLRTATGAAASGTDAVLFHPVTRALGFGLGRDGPVGGDTVFGMAGSGGTAAYADTATGLPVAVTKNVNTFGDHTTYDAV